MTTYTYNAANQRLTMTEGQAGNCADPTAATRTTATQYLDHLSRRSRDNVHPKINGVRLD